MSAYHSSCAGQFSLLEPLEAVENRSLSIWCVSSGNLAAGFTLREGGVLVNDQRVSPGFFNDTYREFILSPVEREDNSRVFQCAIGEFTSNNATLTVFCT